MAVVVVGGGGASACTGGAGASMFFLSCSGQRALVPASDSQGTSRVRMGMQQETPSQEENRTPKAQGQSSIRVGHLSHGSIHFHDDERGDAQRRQ